MFTGSLTLGQQLYVYGASMEVWLVFSSRVLRGGRGPCLTVKGSRYTLPAMGLVIPE